MLVRASCVMMRSLISGWARENAAILGRSQKCENEMVAEMANSSSGPSDRRSATVSAIRLKASPAAADSSLPFSVNSILRWSRRNKGKPKSSSSKWICRLTAAWVTPSSVAARVKLDKRAAASNAVKAVSGGSFFLRFAISLPLHLVMSFAYIYAVE
ncbi:hypothetical protein D9M70_472450 [compost metagenome]